MQNIRTFIAIELNYSIHQVLEEILISLKQANLDAVRWVLPNNIHLTLKFLGDTPASKIPAITGAITTSIENYSPFEIVLDKAGAFPTLKRPRVVWVGLVEQPLLTQLQKKIDSQIERLGFPTENRPFSAHLTLGRVKNEVSQEQLQKISSTIANLPPLKPVSMTVNSITIFKSDLRPSGPIYTPLSKITF